MAMYEAELAYMNAMAKRDRELDESLLEYATLYCERTRQREEDIKECYNTIASKGIMTSPNPIAKDHVTLTLSYDEYMQLMRRISANDEKFLDIAGLFR